MGIYLVQLPEGAYTTLEFNFARIVAADNAADAKAFAARFSVSDAAPWASATATLLTGSTDFSRYTFGAKVVHDENNGLEADVTFGYTPLPTDTVDDIATGVAAAAVAAGLAGVAASTNTVVLPTTLNCGESVIDITPPTWTGESMAALGNVPGGNSLALGGNDFPNYELTGTSILPTVTAAGETVAATRTISFAPLASGINPECFGQFGGGF